MPLPGLAGPDPGTLAALTPLESTLEAEADAGSVFAAL